MNIRKGISNFFKDWNNFFKGIHNQIIKLRLRNKVLVLCFLIFTYISIINFFLFDISPTTHIGEVGKVAVGGWKYLKSIGILSILLYIFIILVIGAFVVIVIGGTLQGLKEEKEFEESKKQNN